MKTFSAPPVVDPELRGIVYEIQAAAGRANPFEEMQVLHSQPRRVRAGMLVHADGTDWDPGSGEGVYYRDEANAAWVFLGASTADDLGKLTVIAIEQLRQLTKIRILLSNMSGVLIEDSDIDVPTYQLRELTKIALILSVMTGTVITDSETDLTNF